MCWQVVTDCCFAFYLCITAAIVNPDTLAALKVLSEDKNERNKESMIVQLITPILQGILASPFRRVYNTENAVWLTPFEYAELLAPSSSSSTSSTLTADPSMFEESPVLPTTKHERKPDLWFGNVSSNASFSHALQAFVIHHTVFASSN